VTPASSPSTGRHWLPRIAVLAVIAALAFATRLFLRLHAERELDQRVQHATAPPTVAVTDAIAEGLVREVKFPGNLVAVTQTMVFARASGYVRSWYVDIGARVSEGDLLALLDTPELNQQLEQARAALSQKISALRQAEANNSFLQLTAKRLDTLSRQQLVAQQDADQANAQAAVGAATVRAAEADVAAQQAAVRQLVDLVAFGRVQAPFAGTISQRLVDVGSLVNAGVAQNGALFQLEANDPLRVFIQIPQTYAPNVRVGTDASVQVRQYAGRTFVGKVTRTAGALDPATRTLSTEIQIANPIGELFSGMYVDVTLPVAVSHPVVRIPSSAVIYDARGVHVAVIDGQSRVHLVAVSPGRDNGSEVEIVDGLSGGERVAVTPPASVVDQMQVQATTAPVEAGIADAHAGGG
jgi:RND family efflux transporter MFP subunit